MSVSVIEQAKIQAQVLVPLVKALQAELGEARANALVRKALGDLYRGFGEEFWKTKKRRPISATPSRRRSRPMPATTRSPMTSSSRRADTFAFDVTRCAYAEFYKALGEPELGFLLVCTADFATAEGLVRRQAHAHADDHAGRQPLRFSLPARCGGITVKGMQMMRASCLAMARWR